MRRRACLILLLALLALRVAPARAEDTYTLAMTWQPAFCGDRAKAPECRLAANEPPRLVLHGLWPDWDVNGDGKRNAGDSYCIAGENDRQGIRTLGGDSDAKGDWLKLPAVKLSTATARDLAVVMPGLASGLDRHEWWKHGTCSGLAAEDYFALAVVLALQVDRSALAGKIAGQAGHEIDRKALLDAFESEFGARSARALTLDCGKGSRLAEIRIRLQRATVTQGLNAGTLAKPGKPAKGDCGARIVIPAAPGHS